MIEKFSDYDSVNYIDQEGNFVFTVKSYELKDSNAGNPMAVFEVEAPEGKTIIRHSLSPKARWSYNDLIAACLNLTAADRKTFECDYELIGKDLVGKSFVGVVAKDSYEKQIKVPNDDGTFRDDVELKESYKIKAYHQVG